MAKNKMTDLRDHLFDTIERLKDPEKETPMDIDTAKTINDLAQTLVSSAKVEATLMMHFDAHKSEFMPVQAYPESKPKKLNGHGESSR